MDGTGIWPDWGYMFFGDTDPSFLIEIAIRTVIVYSYSLALLRWIGGRGIGQMSIIEFLLVVALGSAVGDAMFYPDVPLIHALLVITLVVLINKAIDVGMCKNTSIRRIFAGCTETVIQDGHINRAALEKEKISREELFEGLRQAGISNVARVSHGYLEPSGNFSFFRNKGTVVGLPIVPVWGGEPPPVGHGTARACAHCATVTNGNEKFCERCGLASWTEAVSEDEE